MSFEKLKKSFDNIATESISSSKLADEHYRIEELEYQSKEEDVKKKRLENKSLEQDVFQRGCFSWIILISVGLWIVAVFAVLISAGLGELEFETNVLITLLTTSTINVIALLIIVVNYLFPKNK